MRSMLLFFGHNFYGIAAGDLLLHFTVLHRVKDPESVREALSMLREARQNTK
jgi:hypothetical protein